MYGIYTPVLLFQAYCVYHAYRNNAAQRWYWLILLFPLIGCVIYLLYNFNNRSTLDAFRENMKEAVVSNYVIEQLEKALSFTESFTNRANLADAYVDVGRHKDAIPLYTACLQGFMADDPTIRMKLLYAYFMNDNYEDVVRLGDELEAEKAFRDSEQRLAYAWAINHSGDAAKAEKIFQDMDRSFTNYLHRFEYCKFMISTGKHQEAREKLAEILEEFEQMQASERRSKRPIQREIKALYETLARPE